MNCGALVIERTGKGQQELTAVAGGEEMRSLAPEIVLWVVGLLSMSSFGRIRRRS